MATPLLEIPDLRVHRAGLAVLALLAAWLLAPIAWLGWLAGTAGVVYSLLMVAVPRRMPRVRTGLEGPGTERWTLWGQRLLGLATLPLWVLVLQNRPVSLGLPRSIWMPVVIGLIAAVLFELAGGPPRPREGP